MSTNARRGGYRKSEFGDLVRSNPKLAAKRFRDAWLHSTGATEAAPKLGISRRSFFRYALSLEREGYDVGRPSQTPNPGIDTVR